jgi:acetylornithine deacetylase/succinyl-diaminopimelate desuccinylase-like protein
LKADINRMTRDLAAMVAIPSVNPYDGPLAPGLGEAEMANWLLSAMAEIGLETGRADVLPGRPNVWGRLRGSGGGATLMLAGHMDTVGIEGYSGDPFAAMIRDGRLHGRGAVDMKGALSAMLETARLARSVGLAGDLLLMFVIDEEHLMAGSRAAGRDGRWADACIVCEPTGLAVAPAHKGQSVFPITIEGRAAHSSRSELGENALEAAARLILAIAEHDAALRAGQGHPLLGHARATVVMLKGGESHSAVPGQALLTVDRRTLPGEDEFVVRAEMEALLADVGVRGAVGVPAPEIPGLETSAEAPILRAALEAAAKIGAPTQPVAFPGGTDAPHFGCPAVICGPGDLAQAHASDEFIALAELERAVRLYLEVARRIF